MSPAPAGGRGQPLSASTEPSVRTRRQGCPMADRRAGAASPHTIAAVLAALAMTHVGAATETSCQQVLALSPVAGSTMWCTWRPARRQLRTDVPELARPPWRRATTTSAVAGSAAQSADIPTAQPSSGAPATETSPPRFTSTGVPVNAAILAAARSDASALAVAPRSRTTPSGARRRPSGLSSRQRHPGTGRGRDGRGLARGTSSKSRS